MLAYSGQGTEAINFMTRPRPLGPAPGLSLFAPASNGTP